jgi:hypothetical protein
MKFKLDENLGELDAGLLQGAVRRGAIRGCFSA